MSDEYLVEEARRLGVCRICQKPIVSGPGFPKGWQFEFGKMVFPQAVTLNFGDEFAHTACLEPEAAQEATH